MTPATRKQPARRGRATAPRPPKTGLWIGIGIGIILVIALGAYLIRTLRSSNIVGLQTFSGLVRDHISAPVTYPQNPPVGGPHSPVWQNCGIYDQPIANEAGVHSMEHGAVWITYRSDLPAESVTQLRDLVRGHTYALLSPYENLPAPVVASAWGFQVQAQNAADPQLGQFLTTYERGAQTPEPGAACSGGTGAPVSR